MGSSNSNFISSSLAITSSLYTSLAAAATSTLATATSTPISSSFSSTGIPGGYSSGSSIASSTLTSLIIVSSGIPPPVGFTTTIIDDITVTEIDYVGTFIKTDIETFATTIIDIETLPATTVIDYVPTTIAATACIATPTLLDPEFAQPVGSSPWTFASDSADVSSTEVSNGNGFAGGATSA